MIIIIQGILHPNSIIHSLSTNHCENGGVGEVFDSTKDFWSFRGKQFNSQVAAKLNTAEDIRDLSSDVKKTTVEYEYVEKK